MGDLDPSVAQYIPVAAFAASVIGVVIAWFLGRRSARITTYRSATDLTLDIDRIFIANPGLRCYFYDGAKATATTGSTRQQVLAVAEFVLDCFECIWDIRRTFSRKDRTSWGHYVLDTIAESPVLHDMYTQRSAQQWYPALDRLMKSAKKRRFKRRPAAEESAVSFERLDRATARRVWEFHDSLLAEHFPADELESFDELARSLGDGAGGFLALDGEKVVGGIVDEQYLEAGVQLLGYLVVDPTARGHRLGRQLVHRSVAESRGSLVVGEIEDPRYWSTTPTSDPQARLEFWRKLGCRMLPLPYVQPRLGPDLERVRHLLLVVVPAEDATPPSSVPGPTVATFLREYFTATEGSEPQDAEYRDLIERCTGELKLWPLDDLDAALPVA
ncbi:MAG TPA: GNAT family N-acetyltransferase [Cellulomonas sp.]|nr:GNAT family N-acetyltransferase [Cellulomonas sp.]